MCIFVIVIMNPGWMGLAGIIAWLKPDPSSIAQSVARLTADPGARSGEGVGGGGDGGEGVSRSNHSSAT